MDLPGLTRTAAFLIVTGFPLATFADDQKVPATKEMTPVDRGFGQQDACYGDKYEKDDDLKTGNEIAVQKALDALLNPGS